MVNTEKNQGKLGVLRDLRGSINQPSASKIMKTLIVLFIAICSQSLGDVFLTKGMKSIGEVNTLHPLELFNVGLLIFTTPQIWLGIMLLSIFFGLYLSALSWADLSFVLPVTALGYVMNAVMSWQLLGEQVSPVRWLGTLIICLGVVVVSRTDQRTTKDQRLTGVEAA